MDTRRIYPTRSIEFNGAARVIIASLKQARGKILSPKPPEMRIVRAFPEQRFIEVEVKYPSGPRVLLRYFGVHTRDGWDDYLFSAEVHLESWVNGKSEPISFDTAKLERVSSRARRRSIRHYPTVVIKNDVEKATENAQIAGLIPIQ